MKSGFTIWFTGLSCSGKTTVSQAVARMLRERGLLVEALDGDVVRENLSRCLGFSKVDRDENIRRIAFVSKLLTRNGVAARGSHLTLPGCTGGGKEGNRTRRRGVCELPSRDLHG